MLPWQKSKNNSAGVIMKTRTPDATPSEPSDEKDSHDEGLATCMSELKDALESGDHKAAAKAFLSAFQICELQPHEETDDHSFESQNALAAKDSE